MDHVFYQLAMQDHLIWAVENGTGTIKSAFSVRMVGYLTQIRSVLLLVINARPGILLDCVQLASKDTT